MLISFKKFKDKPNVLVCTRNDDSVSYSSQIRGLETHDVVHLAVESVLKFKNSFYGLVAKGMEISVFSLPKDQWPKMPDEAIQTEFLVNLFQTELNDGKEIENINELIRMNCESNYLSAPKILSEAEIRKIRNRRDELLIEWHALSRGDTMEFEFSEK
jgi:hypothetical protein